MNKRRLLGIALCGMMVGMGGVFAYVQLDKPSTRTLHTSSAVDLSDPKKRVGWADNVFVGEVISKKGTKKFLRDTPETQFNVKVIENIKGELSGEVVVNQLGGYDGEERVLVAGDEMIKESETYMFVVKYEDEHSFYNIATQYGHTKIDNQGEKDKLIKEYKTAFKNQVPFKIDSGEGPDTGDN
ncbi:hypothetical protein SAMN05444487_102276 [Marininema mesophilum]|uniref:Uncharacterized protein n=1 Tax=Marininema mesophilum TaxID=1048340 RepID=A0A1H2SPW6_9BACL|nr:hypothetical protein [Marininema mesophilum]SDW33652.1 hypothetical protein SAMN05444487_102276 [Marininema mesophilum]